MNALSQRLLPLINKDRLRDTLFSFVQVPSPTGQVAAFAEQYATTLRGAGLRDVQLLPTPGWADSPSVVAFRRGAGGGPTLHFNGHMDHIHQGHVAPYIDGDRVVGRGSADMKYGLVGALEVVRVLDEAGVQLPGDILLSGHDLHENPVGHGEGVRSLIDNGFIGDAVIVTEGPKDEVHIGGKSNSLFYIDITWEGPAQHELTVAPGTPSVIEAGARAVLALAALRDEVSRRVDPLLGPESLFIGMSQAGDFYNRLPTSCRIVGTRRFPPEVTRPDVEREICDAVRAAVGRVPLTVKVDASEGNDGFRISPDAPLVQHLCGAYDEINGRPLALGIQLFGADNAKFNNWGGVPAVAHGVTLAKAHAELEWCDVNDLVDVVRVLLLTTLKFYGLD